MKEQASGLPRGGRVLAVDDQPENLVLLEDLLTDAGFAVRLAADGQEAIEQVEVEHPDCIILDIMMPRLDGYGVCERLKSRRDTYFIPIVMLTALSGTEEKVRAYELGADDFLNKPVNVHELLARVRSMVRIKHLRDELNTSEHIIVSMAEALESKDPAAAGHSRRVAATAIALANRLGLTPDRIEVVGKGAVLHDIGRIGIRDSLLGPATERTPEEEAEYATHAALGERILSPFLSFATIRGIVRHHHERLDGSGFPDQIADDEFDQETEIVALANLYDEIATRRSPQAATTELEAAAARGEFRQETVDPLLGLLADGVLDVDGSPPWQEMLPLPGGSWTGRVVVGCASPGTRESLERILAAEGHEVIAVDDGDQVVELVEDAKPDLLLLDVRMPGRSGLEISRWVKGQPETEFLPVLLVTAHDELGWGGRGRAGADDFLFLPVNRTELVARVKSLLRIKMYFKDLEEHQSVILSLAAALETKDPYTRGHSERVGVLAAKLGRALGLGDEQCIALRTAGQLHDIGKIGMPESLLNKRGPLDDEEFAVVKQHPALGERICRPLTTMHSVLPLIRHHHERLDGSGYPDRLRGDELPLGARLLGLADAYDALTSARSYRRNYSFDEALDLLADESDRGRWDPRVLSALVALVRGTA